MFSYFYYEWGIKSTIKMTFFSFKYPFNTDTFMFPQQSRRRHCLHHLLCSGLLYKSINNHKAWDPERLFTISVPCFLILLLFMITTALALVNRSVIIIGLVNTGVNVSYQTANTWSQSDSQFQKLSEGANLNWKGLLLSFFFITFLR